MHEADDRHQPFDFGKEIQEAPVWMQAIVQTHESLPWRRRNFEPPLSWAELSGSSPIGAEPPDSPGARAGPVRMAGGGDSGWVPPHGPEIGALPRPRPPLRRQRLPEATESASCLRWRQRVRAVTGGSGARGHPGIGTERYGWWAGSGVAWGYGTALCAVRGEGRPHSNRTHRGASGRGYRPL